MTLFVEWQPTQGTGRIPGVSVTTNLFENTSFDSTQLPPRYMYMSRYIHCLCSLYIEFSIYVTYQCKYTFTSIYLKKTTTNKHISTTCTPNQPSQRIPSPTPPWLFLAKHTAPSRGWSSLAKTAKAKERQAQRQSSCKPRVVLKGTPPMPITPQGNKAFLRGYMNHHCKALYNFLGGRCP